MIISDSSALVPMAASAAHSVTAPCFPSPPTMPLATLIELVIQSAYHELTVLTDVLPAKTDIERKVALITFSNRIRMLFVRLLALVKWSRGGNSAKVDSCVSMLRFLDRQEQLFVETADCLSRLARETLVRARLPWFAIPPAVDVLTTGTYPRLPLRIKEAIIPEKPLSPLEKVRVLERLNQIILRRLASGTYLPRRLQNMCIGNGRVRFEVKNEFEATLTVMSEDPKQPWRLLEIDILVKDNELCQGMELVHSSQLLYIHQLIQNRLLDNVSPLLSLFTLLHSFCLSLQLEVYHSQCQRLLQRSMSTDLFFVEGYQSGDCLRLGYWRTQKISTGSTQTSAYLLILAIEDGSTEDGKLVCTHQPALSDSNTAMINSLLDRTLLSVESLLMQTIHVRNIMFLRQVSDQVKGFIKSSPTLVTANPPCLIVPLFPVESVCPTHSTPPSSIVFSVDTHTGLLLCELRESSNSCPLLGDVLKVLNGSKGTLASLFDKLRVWFAVVNCMNWCMFYGWSASKRPPRDDHNYQVSSLIGEKVYVRIPRQHTHYLLLLILHNDAKLDVRLRYFIMQVGTPPVTSDFLQLMSPSTTLVEIGPLALKKSTSGFQCTSGLGLPPVRKRRKLIHDADTVISTPCWVRHVINLVTSLEERVTMRALVRGLSEQNILHSGPEMDLSGHGLVIHLLSLPALSSINTDVQKEMVNLLISCSIRLLQKAGSRIFVVEYLLKNSIFPNFNEQSQKRVLFHHELTHLDTLSRPIQMTVEHWWNMLHLFEISREFFSAYAGDQEVSNMCKVEYFNYDKLTLSYGSEFQYTVHCQWRSVEEAFHLDFGTLSHCKRNVNPHLVTAEPLREFFMQERCLKNLVKLLASTTFPLSSLTSLVPQSLVGVAANIMASSAPICDMALIVQTVTHFVLVFRQMFFVDVHCRADGLVLVRDYSCRTSEAKVVEQVKCIPAFKDILLNYSDVTVDMTDATTTCDGGSAIVKESDTPTSSEPAESETYQVKEVLQTKEVAFGDGPQEKGDSMLLQTSSPQTVSGEIAELLPATAPQTGTFKSSSQFAIPPSPGQPLTSSPDEMPPPSPAKPSTLALQPTLASLLSPPSSTTNTLVSPTSAAPDTPLGNTYLAPSPGFSQASTFPTPSPLSQPIPSPASTVVAFTAPSPGSYPIPSPYVPPISSPATPLVPQAVSQMDGLGSPFASGPPIRWPSSPPLNTGQPRFDAPPQVSAPTVRQNTSTNLQPEESVVPKRLASLSEAWKGFTKNVPADKMPVLMSQKAFDMFLANRHPGSKWESPLYTFLSAAYMFIHLDKIVQKDEKLQFVRSEGGSFGFRSDSLLLEICLIGDQSKPLILRVSPSPGTESAWQVEELQLMQRYFACKVGVPAYRVQVLSAFCCFLGIPNIAVLKSFLRLMKLELYEDLSLNWSLTLCLTIPPNCPGITSSQCGSAAVIRKSSKILFVLRLTGKPNMTPPGQRPPVLVLPILYNMQTNVVNVAEPSQPHPQHPHLSIVSRLLTRFYEFNAGMQECSVFPAVFELLKGLNVTPNVSQQTVQQNLK